jgi:uncharacterized repeat protein (TIGR01451 family)
VSSRINRGGALKAEYRYWRVSGFAAAGRRSPIRRAVLALLAALALLAGTLPVAVAAQAAAARPGTLKLAPAKVVAGDTADTLTFTYTAPAKPVTGALSINVPAGFSIPQDTSAAGAGYLSVASGCATFQVAGLAAQPDGSTTVTVSVACAGSLSGTLTYEHVSVPGTAAAYPFAASFTPAGSPSIAFPAEHSVTVKPGPIASVTISPATASITAGGSQAYTAQAFDAFGNSRGDVTASTRFKITPNGSCTGATCTATAAGAHTVTGTHAKLTSTASLTVAPVASADLSAAETVSQAAPDYYTTVTFTTTVTNLSAATGATGVTASVPLPAGLAFVSSGSSGYDASTGVWTIGTVAAGATATLTITARALDVSLGKQTVTATVSSATSDPNPANNAASASETSQPAPVKLTIVPDPGNPSNVDVSLPGNVTWTASEANADNPAAPVPAGTVSWFCYAASTNPCPAADGTDLFNVPTLTYVISSLAADTYTITLAFDPADPNYQTSEVITSITFTVSSSGAG